jgi:hypothetical protein
MDGVAGKLLSAMEHRARYAGLYRGCAKPEPSHLKKYFGGKWVSPTASCCGTTSSSLVPAGPDRPSSGDEAISQWRDRVLRGRTTQMADYVAPDLDRMPGVPFDQVARALDCRQDRGRMGDVSTSA